MEEARRPPRAAVYEVPARGPRGFQVRDCARIVRAGSAARGSWEGRARLSRVDADHVRSGGRSMKLPHPIPFTWAL